MEKDFEIELQDGEGEESGSVQLPMNFLAFGEIENDDVKVYIKQDVYKALEKLSVSDTSKELGSIIIGDYCQELGKTHVIVSDYIEAKYTDASASTLTFTHETWDYVHTEHEKRFSDKKIIGWQHTHPNYGIFLSNYDLFIHENFFNLPFQIAYVIDPIQNLRGFFQWKNGKIEKLKGYYIYDEVGKPIKIEQTKVKKQDHAPAKASKLTTAVLSLLCVSTVLLSGYVVSLKQKYSDQLEHLEGMIQDNEIMIQNNEIIIQNQENTLNELKSLHEEGESEVGSVQFITHTVAAGDTLAKICAEHGLDYEKNIGMIIGINNIKDVNLIYAGQVLLIPVVDA